MVRIRKTVLIEAKQKIKKKKYTITFKWLKMHGKAKTNEDQLEFISKLIYCRSLGVASFRHRRLNRLHLRP